MAFWFCWAVYTRVCLFLWWHAVLNSEQQRASSLAFCGSAESCTAVQRQKAVSAHSTSKQILPSAFVESCWRGTHVSQAVTWSMMTALWRGTIWCTPGTKQGFTSADPGLTVTSLSACQCARSQRLLEHQHHEAFDGQIHVSKILV